MKPMWVHRERTLKREMMDEGSIFPSVSFKLSMVFAKIFISRCEKEKFILVILISEPAAFQAELKSRISGKKQWTKDLEAAGSCGGREEGGGVDRRPRYAKTRAKAF